MGFGSVWHWVIVLLVVLVLFGRGRVSDIMGDFGKGIKSFKEGMADETTNRPVTRLPRSRLRHPGAGGCQGGNACGPDHAAYELIGLPCFWTLPLRNFC
jgi:TatA/E family protein of Tat protein translocase